MNNINQDIIDQARTYIGVPFRHQGRSRLAGIDCVGLVACVGKDLGIINHDYTAYSMLPNPEEMRYHLNIALRKVSIKEMEPGDVLYMRFSENPQHVAIYTEKNTIIHSYLKRKQCVEHILDDVWKKRIVEVYRFRR